MFLYADDTKIMRSISTLADHVQLQTDLDNLVKWCDTWQLNFNATKCSDPFWSSHTQLRRFTILMGSYWTQLIATKTWESYLIQV